MFISQTFMIGIQGKDKSNHVFRRLDVTEIVPVTLELEVPPYAGKISKLKCYA